MINTRRELLQLLAVGASAGGIKGEEEGQTVEDIDYGGQDLRNIASIQFTDRSVQSTAASTATTSASASIPSIPGVHYCNEQHPDLPTIQEAIDAAVDGEHIIITPPENIITETITSTKRLSFQFLGDVRKDADVLGFDFQGRTHIDASGVAGFISVTSNLGVKTGSADGIRFANKFTVAGVLRSNGHGGHGILFDNTVGNNMNQSTGLFGAVSNGGDGLRVDGGANANGWPNMVVTELRNNDGAGLRILPGVFAQLWDLGVVEGNGKGVVVGDDSQYYVSTIDISIRDLESNGVGIEVNNASNSTIGYRAAGSNGIRTDVKPGLSNMTVAPMAHILTAHS